MRFPLLLSSVATFACLATVALAGVLLSPAACSAQQVALADAPLPAFSSSALPALEAAAAPAYVLTPISAPAHRIAEPRLHLLDWSGIAAAAALRVLDYTSTEAALEHPQYLREAVLPNALVHNKPAFAAFQAGTVALNYGAYRLLIRHHLRSLARISQTVYVGILSGQVARNYQNLSRIPSR